MTCPSCDRPNRDGARFCGGCGGSLAPRCPSCGAESVADARFCDACGAALVAKSAETAGARKVVTIVFADLVGSTALHERLDAESARRFVERYYGAMRDAVAAHGGSVAKLLGDGVMAVFGVPRVAEDDALRAVRGAVAMQEAFQALAAQQRGAIGTTGLRIAVNTGEVVVKDETEIIGDPVNVAARLQDQGRDGDVVIGEATRQLVAGLVTLEPLGSVTLKGRAEAVSAYRVVSLDRPASATTAAFVGRTDELARLTAVYDAAVTAPAARLAVLLGSPGLGKSRLIDEFVQRRGDAATVLLAQCDAAGGATFAPLARALRERLGIDDATGDDALRAAVAAALPGDDAERARIAGGIAALLAGSPAPPEETFFVVRRLLTALAAARPVVLVIDDLHWAEPLLLDLVEHLVQWSGGVPLLVLVGARPELRDTRSSLTMPGPLVADVVTLAGLDAGAAMRLAANVIGAADLPAAVAARVLATSEGNPLFVGELVRMLVQEGALTREGERWTAGAGLAALEMPPTIHALLAARIERLGPEERTVLERAAVVGRNFSRSAVAALAPRESADLDARLEALRRSELIERDAGWFLGEPGLRFHHMLIRDAAYRRVLKGTRAELHGRLADWIEARVGDAPEHDETIGWHLEQAHQHLRELGPVDPAGALLGARAARRLAAAGRRALARDDVSLAAGLLGRALARLAPDAPERADLVLDWCEALLSAGAVGAAAAAIDELERVAADSARLRAWHTCFAGQLTVLTAPEALHATSGRVGAAARELAALDDAAGEAKAHFVHAQALARLGKVGACEAALDQALAAARRAGDRRRANAVLAGAPLAALWGPSPVTRASGRCLDVVRVLRITQGAPAVEAVALSCQGVLEALRGRTEAARRMLASSRTMVEELGISHRLHETDVFAGRIDLLEGDAPAAERALRAGYEGLRDLGLGIDAARAAALLGRALLAQDRAAEAERLSHESELLAGDDLQAAIAWRGVRAEALARRGDHATAIALAEAAVAIAAATDALLDHADARLALAAALRAAGRRAEADAEERRAFDLWEAKGATVLAERARRAVDGSVSAAPATETRPQPRGRRHVRPNAATETNARGCAAIAAGDAASLPAMFNEAFEEIDHPTGSTYGREAAVASIARLMRSHDVSYHVEPLATLGATIMLARRRIHASGTRGHRFDVGEYENEALAVYEVDAQGRDLRHEVFAADKLGEATARLYERWAEGLPHGTERERAAVAARAVVFMLTPSEAPDLAELYAPTYEDVDHRSVGYGTLAREDSDKLLRSFREVADGIRFHVDDVLALDPRGLVRKTTASGVWREGGGAFERTVCTLSVFGPDGRVTRHETFDADREAEAIARFEALTTPPAPARTAARVRPNAALRMAERLVAAMAGADVAAISDLVAADVECIHHPTGTTWDRAGQLTLIGQVASARNLDIRAEYLATLGDSLVLFREWSSWESMDDDALGPFGAVERERFNLFEVDANGCQRRVEFFAVDHLGDAIARLYERYAELLADGAARDRATTTASAIGIVLSPNLERYAEAFAPDIEFHDHRTLGFGPGRGAARLARGFAALAELADGFGISNRDVLRLEYDALLAHGAIAGTDRRSGGAFELPAVNLFLFGPDGRIAHYEAFDADREAEALVRFDLLTGASAPKRGQPVPPPSRVRPNAVTHASAEFEAIVAARDFDVLATSFAEDAECIDHPTGATYGAEGMRTGVRRLMQSPDASYRVVPLATLGPSWGLVRREMSASGAVGGRFDVGAYEIVDVSIYGTDERGRIRDVEIFAAERLHAAIARFYGRYAESLPEGAERTRTSAIARTLATIDGPLDADRMARTHAPSFDCVDHRTLGTWSAPGLEEWLKHWRAQADLAADFTFRDDAVLALEPGAILLRDTFFGTSRMSGGYFENVILVVNVFGADGLVTHTEVFEPDHEAEAFARFDALTAGAAPRLPVQRRVRPNAATRTHDAIEAAFARRDLGAIDALLGDPMETIEHPTGTTYGREGQLESSRRMMRMPDLDFRIEPLATLGDSLCLARRIVTASGTAGSRFDVGEFEIESIILSEVDAVGRLRSSEVFASNHLGQATARLYARYAGSLPEGPERTRAEGIAHAHSVWHGPLDTDRVVSAVAPSYVCVDHRSLGTWSTRGRDEWLRHWRGQADLAAGFSRRDDDILAFAPDANVMRHTYFGTNRASGGPFENVFLALNVFGADGLHARCELFEPDQEVEALARFDELGAAADHAQGTPQPTDGRITRVEMFEADHLDRARARLAELRPDPLRIPPNAATRLIEGPLGHAWRARDFGAFREFVAPDFVYEDRGKRALVSGNIDTWNSSLQFWPAGTQVDYERLGTLGDRIALDRFRWKGAPDDDTFEIERVTVTEVDESGRLRAVIRFDPDDRSAASFEAVKRFTSGEAAAAEELQAYLAFGRAFSGRRWDDLRAVLTTDCIFVDHRLLGLGTLDGDQWIVSLTALAELAPDLDAETRQVLAWSRHGLVSLQRNFGTVPGGGPFENFYIMLVLIAGARVRRIEGFDPTDADRAVARFAELCEANDLDSADTSVRRARS